MVISPAPPVLICAEPFSVDRTVCDEFSCTRWRVEVMDLLAYGHNYPLEAFQALAVRVEADVIPEEEVLQEQVLLW